MSLPDSMSDASSVYAFFCIIAIHVDITNRVERRARPEGGGVEVSSVTWDRVEHVRRVEHPDGGCDVVFSVTYEEYYGPTEFRAVTDGPACEQLARGLIEGANS